MPYRRSSWDPGSTIQYIWAYLLLFKISRWLRHPPFKATWTGARRTRLGNYDFCPRLAETKRENIILDHMNSRICLGSSRFWLHKFDKITTKRDYFSHISHQQTAPVLNTGCFRINVKYKMAFMDTKVGFSGLFCNSYIWKFWYFDVSIYGQVK